MTRWQAIRLTLWSSLASVVTQIIAVLTLDASAFGVFSLAMLGYGWCSSLSLSLVSEPWTRDGDEEVWGPYATALLALSVAAGVVGLGIALVTWSLAGAILAVAIALSTYRLGARFHSLGTGVLRYVGRADIAAFLVTVAAWALAATVLEPLLAVAVGWLLGAIASVVLSRPPRIELGALGGWFRGHARSIRTLLADSALLDANAIGVPLLFAPLLGIREFGVYRAMSSAAVPVRLALSPIRPIAAKASVERSMRTAVLLLLVAAGVLVGAAVATAIWLVTATGLVRGTVLDDLAGYAAPVAAFIAASMPLYYAQMVARTHLGARALLTFRIASLVLGAALPLGGLAIFDLAGAIWGAALAALIDGIVVITMLRRRRRGIRADAPNP